MTLEWNRVTWYSKAAAVVVFLGAFGFAFWLGMQYGELQRDDAPAATTAGPAAGTTGAHCGGFIRNAPTCAAGYHCVLTPSRPDIGGTCVPDNAQ